MATLFVEKKIDVNQKNGNDYTVLWHLVESRFDATLVNFYLQHNVDVKHISKWDKTCVLHGFAAFNDISPENRNDFLEKVRLMLSSDDTIVNTRDENNATPINVAESTIRNWGKTKPACIEPLREFIALCRKYGGKSTQELQLSNQKIKRITV